MNKKLIFVITSLLLLLLSGCSTISISYNYADTYLRYSINSYASFNDEQKIVIEKEVNGFMSWHRQHMLPEYVRFLQPLQLIVQSGAELSADDVAGFRGQIRSLYVKTLQPTVKPAASLLSGVAPSQIDELHDSFAKENNKQRERDLSGDTDKKLRKRAERSIDFLEDMVGEFSDKQLEKIRQMSYKLPFATGIYLGQRETNQAHLLELLRKKSDKEELEIFLAAWLMKPEANRTPEEQAVLHAFESASNEMIADIYRLLSDRQRKILLKNIMKYIDSFQELASAS